MTGEIFDVVLQSTGRFRASICDFQKNPPPSPDFSLDDDLWVGSLPHDVSSDIVFDACDPAGFNFRPIRQYGMRYAFCHRVQPVSADPYAWDSSRRLSRVVFLSRLIRPTTIATCYSAKLFFENHQLKTIVPGPTQGPHSYAWVVARDDWRDWLSVHELERLRDLSALYRIDVAERVRQARKHIDYAFHSFYLDQRFASLVTSFESLLKVSNHRSTSQFASRVPQLATRLSYELTSTEAKRVYQDRSAFVHGSVASFNEVSELLIDQYEKFERVLRLALLRASTESAFAQLFISPESVVEAFGD